MGVLYFQPENGLPAARATCILTSVAGVRRRDEIAPRLRAVSFHDVGYQPAVAILQAGSPLAVFV
jgi:hypothetical protein